MRRLGLPNSKRYQMTDPFRLTVFNHKGGVGKTTLTANIAWALSMLGKKVLIVDSDPQCNITSYFFEDSVVNDLLDRAEKPTGRTIWSSVRPIVNQTGDIKIIEPHSVQSLQVVPGDIRLAEFEEFLGEAWTDCFKRRLGGFRAMTAISAMVNRIIGLRPCDFVFFDAGPNIGPLNRALLLGSDAFIVPVACDLFSVRALATLGQKLKEWIIDWRTIVDLAPDDIQLLKGAPKFLGYVPQRFKVYGKAMASEPAYYLRTIKQRIKLDITNVLQEIDRNLVPIPQGDLEIGAIKNYDSLVQAAQREGVAIWDCSSGDAIQKSSAKDAFAKLAHKLIELRKSMR